MKSPKTILRALLLVTVIVVVLCFTSPAGVILPKSSIIPSKKPKKDVGQTSIKLKSGKKKVASSITPSSSAEEYVSSHILVKFKPEVKKDAIDNVNSSLGGKIERKISSIGVYVITIPESSSAEEMVKSYSHSAYVEYAEPDGLAYPGFIPNDPDWSKQWGPKKIQADIAWNYWKGSSSTVIAILDSGIDIDHPDLSSRLVAGYDFANSDSVADDDYGHGTHVAGIASATTNNGAGIAGVGFNCKLMPVKVITKDGLAYWDVVANGITYAADHGAKVINMSIWSGAGGGTYLQFVQDAVNYAYNKGCVLVACRGNSNDSSLQYPACYQNVVSVSGTDSNDARYSYSCYGQGVDVSAPAVSIYSCFPNHSHYYLPYVNNYAYLSGTSMAAPHVSGLAALLLSRGGVSNAQVEQMIKNSADDLGSPGYDDYFGYGRINANRAINLDPPPIEIKPEPANGKDSSIEALNGYRDSNYGAMGWIGVGRGYIDLYPDTDPLDGDEEVRRGLLQFDVSSIPPSTAIKSATLSLYACSDFAKGAIHQFNAHQVTQSWQEGLGQETPNSSTINGTTWNVRYYGGNWGSPGVSYDSSPQFSSSTMVGAANSWYSFDVKSLVQKWVDTPSSNYGLMIKANNENVTNQKWFRSSDYSGVTYRPRLNIVWDWNDGASPASAGSGLFDPGFESATWQPYITNQNAVIEQSGYYSQVHSGSKSLRISNYHDGWVRSQRFGVNPSTTYTLSGWVYTDYLSQLGQAYMGVEYYDFNQNLIPGYNDYFWIGRSQGTWGYKSGSVRTPANCYYMTVRVLSHRAVGEAFFDDFSVNGASLPDSSFESATWQPYVGNQNTTIEQDGYYGQVHSGSKSLRISNYHDGWVRSQKFAVNPSTTYTLSGWVYTDYISQLGQAYLGVEYYDINRNMIGGYNDYFWIGRSQGTWGYKSGSVRTPANCYYMTVRVLSHRAVGEAFFDDFSVSLVEN